MRGLGALAAWLACAALARAEAVDQPAWSAAPPVVLSLDECIDAALAGNRARPVARLGVELAEAQYRQALSAYWPQVGVSAALTRRDDDPLCIFSEQLATYTTVVGGHELQGAVVVPETATRLMDRTNFLAASELTLPLYTGGLRPSLARQAQAGLEAARQEARRTDLQVVEDVHRAYYGAVLARGLAALGGEALERLEVTLDVTEALYKGGTGRVQKTDYLKHQAVVESLRGAVAAMDGNAQLARAALANAVGMPWSAEVEPAVTDLPFEPFSGTVGETVADAYRWNPQWARLQAGLRATTAKVDEARSYRLPRLALLGRVAWLANSWDKGLVGPQEDRSWQVGLGLTAPVFDGFLTRHRVREAQDRVAQLEHQQELLREGLGLRVKAVVLQLQRLQAQEDAARAAAGAAEENRRLSVRAYQDGRTDVEELIEAQLLEAFARARHLKVRHDHAVARAQLEAVVGRLPERAQAEPKSTDATGRPGGAR